MSGRMRWSAAQIAEALGAPPPTREQVAVIEAPVGASLVIAGAGSGKTETMAARVVWLVANGVVLPEEVLGLTFTRKAALELSERLTRRLRTLQEVGLWQPEEGLVQPPTVSTYHAYAGRLVVEHGLRIGLEPGATLFTEAACWQVAAEVVTRHEGDLAALERAPSTIIDAVLSLAGELAEHLQDEQSLLDYLHAEADRLETLPGRDGKAPLKVGATTAADLRHQAAIVPLVQEYRQALAQRGGTDFASQMAAASRLSAQVPAVGEVERSRVRAVLLDEFQDTSEAQLALLARLFAHPGIAVTAVGDPHQSIYGWRGASANTLARFRTAFADDVPTPVLSLSTSWRNDAAVLGAANVCATPLRQSATVPVVELAARPDAGPGSVRAARVLTHEDEADLVAAWARRHWQVDSQATRPSVAVLCRTRAQFSTVVSALRAADLPVEVVGLGGLLTAPEVADLVALLTVAHDPSRGDELMRLLTGPVARLGAADLDGLWGWSLHLQRERASIEPATTDGSDADAPGEPPRSDDRGTSRGAGTPGPLAAEPALLADALADLPEEGWSDTRGRTIGAAALRRLRWLDRVIRGVRSRAALPLPDLVLAAERLLGLDIEVASDPHRSPAWGRAQLDQLVEVAEQFRAGTGAHTLGAFVTWLEAARDRERGLEPAETAVSAEAIQVMTVHAAKGLEWDVVALPGLVEGTFPSFSARTSFKDGQWVATPPGVKGWLTGLGSLPYPMRGDVTALPSLDWEQAQDTHELRDALERFAAAGVEHSIAEERRLAYVAMTRARREVLLTAPVWSTASTPRVTSRFLTEVRESRVPVRVEAWEEMPEPTQEGTAGPHPLRDVDHRVPWPQHPDSSRWAAVDLTQAWLEEQRGVEDAPTLPDPDWQRQVDLLLAEHHRGPAAEPQAAAGHVSASALVALSRDPAAFRRGRRRPMPQPPAPGAMAGSEFHQWVQQHYTAATLAGADGEWGDLFDVAAAQERVTGEEEAGPATALTELQRAFRAGPWADRTPAAVELDIETVIADLPVRCRIDAVFTEPDGSHVVVDWKTGADPGEDDLRHLSVQLSVYRVAYSRLTGTPLERVSAAFWYVRSGRELRPRLWEEPQIEALVRAAAEPG